MEPELFSENNIRKISGAKFVKDITANYHRGNPMSVQANKIAREGKVSNRQRILDILSNNRNELVWTCEALEEWTSLTHAKLGAAA